MAGTAARLHAPTVSVHQTLVLRNDDLLGTPDIGLRLQGSSLSLHPAYSCRTGHLDLEVLPHRHHTWSAWGCEGQHMRPPDI